MNWDAIGAIADLVGAAGVIASLLYLAVQVRHAARTAEDSAFRDIFAHLNEHINVMLALENREVIFRGLADYGGLPGQDKYVFDFLLTGYVNLLESALLANDADLLADVSLEDWGYHFRTRFLTYKGTLEWWTEAQYIFRRETRTWIDQQIERTDMASDIWNIK